VPEKANLPRGGDAKLWVCNSADSQAAECNSIGSFLFCFPVIFRYFWIIFVLTKQNLHQGF